MSTPDDNGENPFANPTSDPPPHDTSAPEPAKIPPAPLPLDSKATPAAAAKAAGPSILDRVRDKPIPFIGGGAAVALLLIGGLAFAMCGDSKPTAPVGKPIAAADAAVAPVAVVPTASATNTAPAARASGTRGCQEGEFVCSDDEKEMFQCNGGRLMITYRQCRGPKGCKTIEGKAVCDQTIAEQGDICWNHGRFACGADFKSQYMCTSGTFMRIRGCIHKGCSIKSLSEVVCD